MKISDRIGLLFITTLIGVVVFYVLAIASKNGMLTQWKYLGKPPEPPVSVIRPGYIKTDAGNIYQYNDFQTCNLGCWEKIDTLPPNVDPEFSLELSACNSLGNPSLDDYIDSKAVCERSFVGATLSIYVIGKDGFVYSWENSNSEGTAIMMFIAPFLGAMVGFLIGVLVILIDLFSGMLNHRIQKDTTTT